MNVVTNNGNVECRTPHEVENIIINSSFNPFDDIWISGTEKYPCLAILLNGSFACVHYFLNEYGDMWQSSGNQDEDVEFVIGGEKSEMPADTIIPLEKAIECVNQFWNSNEIPTCIEWREL